MDFQLLHGQCVAVGTIAAAAISRNRGLLSEKEYQEILCGCRDFGLPVDVYKRQDVGLVGFPNVGKSTFLSRVTNAQPKIANYHFTTLSPNLGVVDTENGGFVIADIPGLIEGASEGVGLGHEFLRHIERTRVLVHIVDAASTEGRDPVDDIYKINKEMCIRDRERGLRGCRRG